MVGKVPIQAGLTEGYMKQYLKGARRPSFSNFLLIFNT